MEYINVAFIMLAAYAGIVTLVLLYLIKVLKDSGNTQAIQAEKIIGTVATLYPADVIEKIVQIEREKAAKTDNPFDDIATLIAGEVTKLIEGIIPNPTAPTTTTTITTTTPLDTVG